MHTSKTELSGTSATELSGTGADLPAALRQLSALKRTGWIYVGTDSWTASLFVEMGRVVSATFGSREGIEALTELAHVWPVGEFVFEPNRPGPARRTVDISADRVLAWLHELGGDAAVELPEQLMDAVPHLLLQGVGGVDTDPVHLNRSMLRTLRAVDGKRSVAEIVSLQDSPSAIAHLAKLRELRLIGFVGAPKTEPSPEPLPPVPAPARAIATCPKLGTDDDSSGAFDRPTGLHRCFASGRPVALALKQQRDVCLSTNHTTCPLLASSLVTLMEPETVQTLAPPPKDTPPEPEVDDVSRIERLRSRFADVDRVRLGLALSLVLLAIAVAIALIVNLRNAAQPHPVPPVATPAPTLAPRATPEPTAAPLPESSAVPALIAPNTVLREPFADNTANWLNDPQGPAWLKGGAYQLAARQPKQFVAIAAPVADVFGDVTVSATFRKVGGPAGGGYGIIVRDQGPGPRDGRNQNGRYYVLEVGDTGQVGIWRRDGDHWTDILPWTNSTAVRPGTESNQLVVRVAGDRFTLAVNGTDVETRTDGALAFGGVGLFVGGDQNEVQVDDFTILAPATS
jgi:hypothetical protein